MFPYPSPTMSQPARPDSRRRFLALAAGAVAALAGFPARSFAMAKPAPGPKHPDPRPGITAAKVLPAEKIHNPDAVPIFDLVRQIPGVVDGIRCNCGCAELEGYYSLLSCYEEAGMAQACVICQGQAKLAFRLHQEGWSLNGIRASIDAAFGQPS